MLGTKRRQMKRDKRKQQIRRGSPELPHPKCVYCQERDGLQVEHVVARAFFQPPLPVIPKVPACRECNQLRGDGGARNMSDDEAYVRDRICMHIGTDDHPDARELLTTKVFRNLSRPESAREKQTWLESVQPATVTLAPDIYLANVWSFEFEMDRFERVVRKIVKGLHAYHHRTPVPRDFGFETVRIMDGEMFQRSKSWILSNDPSPQFAIGDRQAVWYQFASRRVNPNGNNWLLVFYHRFAFYVHAGPEGRCGKLVSTNAPDRLPSSEASDTATPT